MNPSPAPACADETTTIVIPCYNEAARLDLPAFAELLAGQPHVAITFVDDGSRDGTAALLETFAVRHPGRVVVLRLPANGGKAGAVRQGLLAALEQRPADVGFWDADLATPLSALNDFAALLRREPRCQWVIGSRVRLLGRRIERRAARHYAGRIFATAASLVLGLAVYDTQCGAKLFRATPALRECLGMPFHSRWIFDVELIARFQTASPHVRLDDLIHEFPLREWRDVGGSKVGPGAFVRGTRAAAHLPRIPATALGVGSRTHGTGGQRAGRRADASRLIAITRPVGRWRESTAPPGSRTACSPGRVPGARRAACARGRG